MEDECWKTSVAVSIALTPVVKALAKCILQSSNLVIEPARIRALAKAESDAALVRAESEERLADLHYRAMRRRELENIQHQWNIESILIEAIPDLLGTSDPTKVDKDWMNNFSARARLVSDETMQNLWGRILAGEVNKPGTFSRRTVNLLSELDKGDALSFSELYRYHAEVKDLESDRKSEIHLFYFTHDRLFRNMIKMEEFRNLYEIGLITYDHSRNYYISTSGTNISLRHHSQVISLELCRKGLSLPAGCVKLTRFGQEIGRLCIPNPVPDLLVSIKVKWKNKIIDKNENS